MSPLSSRRLFLVGSGASGASLILGCSKDNRAGEAPPAAASATRAGAGEGAEPEVTATEDLMREHGVIRRALVVYREAAARLRTNAASVPRDALEKAARLLRTFGEDYHEKKLEEAHVFPMLRRTSGQASSQLDAAIGQLTFQHNRGREITDYVISLSTGPAGPGHTDALARALEGFARMYEAHAAMEDTVIFPAWKKTMKPGELAQIGGVFEDIEHATFGKDGFDEGVDQIATVERAFGIDLAELTAPPPPKA